LSAVPFPWSGGTNASAQDDVTMRASVAAEPPHQHEHSAGARRPASAVPSIKGLRISPPGFKATLVDISESGLLAEWGLALKVGQAVAVDFEGTFSPQSLRAQVVRTAVACMTSVGVRYYVGLAFTAPIAFEEEPPRPPDISAVQASVTDDIENSW
jgi:hypothetical protein